MADRTGWRAHAYGIQALLASVPEKGSVTNAPGICPALIVANVCLNRITKNSAVFTGGRSLTIIEGQAAVARSVRSKTTCVWRGVGKRTTT
jgi:hypothetical protein